MADAEFARSHPRHRQRHRGGGRYFANRFGCRVTGTTTPEFCDVARELTRASVSTRRSTSAGDAGDAVRRQRKRRLFDERLDEHRRQGRLPRDSPRAEARRLADALRSPKGRATTPLSDSVGREREDELSRFTRSHAQRSRRSRLRHRSDAQHARAGARRHRSGARHGQPRREAAASRCRADTRRDRRCGNGEHGARARGRAPRADRSARDSSSMTADVESARRAARSPAAAYQA